MEFFWLLGSRARSAATSQKEKRAKGDDRKVWHKIIETDGTTIEGVGTLSEKIVAGSGEASDWEEFSCAITYDKTPEVTEPTLMLPGT